MAIACLSRSRAGAAKKVIIKEDAFPDRLGYRQAGPLVCGAV
jgi:hypothetical protein